MNIYLNTAVIPRSDNTNNKMMITFNIVVNDTIFYKNSHRPSKSAIGSEPKGELYAIHQLLLKCSQAPIINAHITIPFVKGNSFAKIYRNEVKDLSSLTSTKLIDTFSKIQSSIDTLISRKCTVSFVEVDNYNTELLDFANEELKRDVLTEPFDNMDKFLVYLSTLSTTYNEEGTSLDDDSIKSMHVLPEFIETEVIEPIEVHSSSIELVETPSQEGKNSLETVLVDSSEITGDYDLSLNNSDTLTNKVITLPQNNTQGSNIYLTKSSVYEDSINFYTESIKSYKEQLTNIDLLHNVSTESKNNLKSTTEPSEYLALLSEELNSIKNQCDFYDDEILKVKKDIEDTISLKEATQQECELLLKEVARLNTELSESIKVIESNINLVAQTNEEFLNNKFIIHSKTKELRTIEQQISNTLSSNSNMINYLRGQIEKTTIEKFLLLSKNG